MSVRFCCLVIYFNGIYFKVLFNIHEQIVGWLKLDNKRGNLPSPNNNEERSQNKNKSDEKEREEDSEDSSIPSHALSNHPVSCEKYFIFLN